MKRGTFLASGWFMICEVNSMWEGGAAAVNTACATRCPMVRIVPVMQVWDKRTVRWLCIFSTRVLGSMLLDGLSMNSSNLQNWNAGRHPLGMPASSGFLSLPLFFAWITHYVRVILVFRMVQRERAQPPCPFPAPHFCRPRSRVPAGRGWPSTFRARKPYAKKEVALGELMRRQMFQCSESCHPRGF